MKLCLSGKTEKIMSIKSIAANYLHKKIYTKTQAWATNYCKSKAVFVGLIKDAKTTNLE
jgi:hypothetical protein